MSATNGKASAPPPFSRRALIDNAYTTAREQWLRRVTGASDPRRNIDHECGYPEGPVDAQSFQDLYDREPVACRVVQVFPKETWQTQPQVYELEDSEEATPFEAAWDSLSRQLKGGNSYHQDEEGSLVWEYLRRCDILSGIGYFGILLLGIDDGLPLSEPVRGIKEQNSLPAEHGKPSLTPSLNEVKPYRLATNADPVVSQRKLLFVRVFPESLVEISRYETNWTSPRFGQPVTYSIVFNDPHEFHMGAGLPMASREVHWTRVVHVADNLGSSEIFGVPRMQPVLNPLLDIRKVRGGSAEMYWLGAFGGLSLSTHPQLGGDVEVDETKLKEMMENRNNGLQRDLFLMGMTAAPLAPQVVDPTPQINAQVEAICIQLGIPVRVFKGSERGELASSQDDAAWNDRLRERQSGYVTPRLIVPFVDRLICLGVLPEPTGYSVWWPDLTSQTEAEKATVAATKTTALAAYVGGNVEGLVAPMDYLTRVLGFSDEEAAAIVENASAAAGEGEVDAIEGDDVAAEEGTPQETEPAPEEESADPVLGNAWSEAARAAALEARRAKMKGGSVKPKTSLASRVGSILSGAALAAWSTVSVSAKVVGATAKVLTKGIGAIASRYGNGGSLATYLVAHTIFSGASVFTGGGAALLGAAAFGLASVEVRGTLKKLVGLTTNADAGLEYDEDELSEDILRLVNEIAVAAGVELEISKDEVKQLLQEVTLDDRAEELAE